MNNIKNIINASMVSSLTVFDIELRKNYSKTTYTVNYFSIHCI